MRASSDMALPLTPMQQGMLFHSLYDSAEGLYVTQICCRVSGKLDPGTLRAAWSHIVDRHDALRTALVKGSDGKPAQVIKPDAAIPWEEFDWSDTERFHDRMAALLEADRAQSFDFEQAPLMRLKLIRTAPLEHVLVWTHHHVILDGWSVQIVLREVIESYDAFLAGTAPELPSAKSFVEYVRWLEEQDRGGEQAFWKSLLAGFTEPAPLQVGRRTPQHRCAVENVVCTLDRSKTDRLVEFARTQRVTLSTVVQAGWALLMSRYSGTDDVVYGATFSGRPADLTDSGGMVGMFINTLPVRVRIPRDGPVGDWIKTLQQELLAIHEFEHSAITDIRGWSAVAGGRPLFESIVVFENYPAAHSLQGKSIEISDVRFVERSNLPLTLIAVPGLQLQFDLAFRTDRFDRAVAGRMIAHLREILLAVTRSPSSIARNIPMLSEAERMLLLVDWNATQTTYPRDFTIHELFETEVAARPNAIALVQSGVTVTYAELDQLASALAQRLRRNGVGPGMRVGIFVERSVEMIVAILATLKVGAAYVPLDATDPVSRLEFVVRDAGVAAVLCNGDLPFELPPNVPRVPAGDPSSDETAHFQWKGDIACRGNAEDPACVMYTSGTSGNPKGVLVPHRAVVRLVRGARYAHFGPKEVFLQYAPLAFDASTFEIWGPLLNGGSLVLMAGGQASLAELARAIRDHRITTLWLTAGLFHLMVDEQMEALKGLKQLLAGGDALSVQHVRKFLLAAPNTRLINGYGPTENTTFTCCCDLTLDSIAEGSVPIGRPISNTLVYIVDDALDPVPIGVSGELCAAGDGLALGYVNQPELTARSFVANPFADSQSQRMYRTGDRARYREDGTIEFLGRQDRQVKIRGFRVELAEIEAVLKQHFGVRDAIVALQSESAPDAGLVAYWTAADPSSANLSEELLQHARAHLPSYMVPLACVPVAALPLTRNGKVDREAVRAVARAPFEIAILPVAPRTDVEECLHAIWRDLLRTDRFGIDDSFFALGGHSLLVTQMAARIARAFNVELPLRELFEARTISGVAQLLSSRQAAAAPNRSIQPHMTREAARALLDRLEDLSESEVDALLDSR